MEQQPISLFDSIDPDITERLVTRQQEVERGVAVDSKITAALALGSIPIALGVFAQGAFAQAIPAVMLTVLNFALALEYLEAQFYATGVGTSGLITASTDRTIFTTISGHETAHVSTLQAVITANGGTPITQPTFDFTAGGLVTTPFGVYSTFQALAQAFEDTGVRAYKGQAPNLMGNAALLTAALSIHAVEAEHASEVRRLRGQTGWITGDSNGGLPAFTQAIYNGEDNTVQAGIDLSTQAPIPTDLTVVGTANVFNAVTEAFDEPLAASAVVAITGPFFVGGFPSIPGLSALG